MKSGPPIISKGECEICGFTVFHYAQSPRTRYCGYICRNKAYRARRNSDPVWPREAVTKIAIDWLIMEGVCDMREIQRVTRLNYSTVQRRVRALVNMSAQYEATKGS